MAELYGLCDICGKIAKHKCKLCGKRVCDEHYDAKSGTCTTHSRGRSVR